MGAGSTRSPRNFRVVAEPPARPDPAARTLARLRATLGAATLVMLALSWPLWVERDAMPRVPFVAAMPSSGEAASWAAFGLLLASVATATAGIAWRGSLAI